MTARLSERSGKFTIGSVCGVALTRAERLCSRALQAYEHFWRVLELQRLDVAAVPGAEFAASLPQTRLALLRPHASRALPNDRLAGDNGASGGEGAGDVRLPMLNVENST
jgi:hypothetical protein